MEEYKVDTWYQLGNMLFCEFKRLTKRDEDYAHPPGLRITVTTQGSALDTQAHELASQILQILSPTDNTILYHGTPIGTLVEFPGKDNTPMWFGKLQSGEATITGPARTSRMQAEADVLAMHAGLPAYEKVGEGKSKTTMQDIVDKHPGMRVTVVNGSGTTVYTTAPQQKGGTEA